jgi:Vacuolar protein sorting-associated protein 62
MDIVATNKFVKIFDDKGTNAFPNNCAIFRPVVPDGYYMLGDLLSHSHGDVPSQNGTDVSLAIRCVNSTPTSNSSTSNSSALLRAPVDFELVWCGKGMKGRCQGAVWLWLPVAHSQDFVPLGLVATANNSKPDTEKIRICCVHKSLCVAGTAVYDDRLRGTAFWTPHNTGAKHTALALWQVRADLALDERGLSPATFMASVGDVRRPPRGSLYALLNPFVADSGGSGPEHECAAAANLIYPELASHAAAATATAAAAASSSSSSSLSSTNAPSAPPIMDDDDLAPGYQLLRITYPDQFFTRQVVKPVVEVAPFDVSERQCLTIVDKWRSSLWFAPAGFAKADDIGLRVRAAYVPYFSFSASVSTDYDGEVGWHRQRRRRCNNRGGGEQTIEHYTEWSHGRRYGSRHADYPNVLVCGTSNEELASELARVEQRFDLSRARPAVATSTEEFEVPRDWQRCWLDEGEPTVAKRERRKARDELRRQASADEVRAMHVTVRADALSYRFAFMPVYRLLYTWGDTQYRLYVNGQDGGVWGKRPWGFGALGGFFKSSHASESAGLVRGVELLGGNNASSPWCRSPDATYVVFPPSERKGATLGMSRHNGSIELRNSSNAPIELLAIDRSSSSSCSYGMPYALAAGAAKSFRFQGHWAVEVVCGDAASLTIESFERRDGDASSNLLGMASGRGK